MENSRVCDNCGCYIESNETLYVMQVAIMAEPGPEIDIPEITDIDDVRKELEKLIRAMEGMSEEEVEEAAEQVHESYRFVLCTECREEVHGRLKRRSRILGE